MTPNDLKVLYVGDLWEGSTALHRMQALAALGARIVPVDTLPPAARKAQRHFHRRVQRRLFGPPDLAGANDAIRRLAARERPDLLWVDKGVTIDPATLREARAASGCVIAGYSPDDMMNPGNLSRRYVRGLPEYDVYFTTKSYGVEELEHLGAREVRFVGNAYDPRTHRPVVLDAERRRALGGPVGFVGMWERERAESIGRIATAGVPVRVWGGGWERWRCDAPSLRVESRPVFADEYAQALCAFDINLCFLRKANRDLQTTRSIEIPACGAFMLAERTDEHRELFEEGREAEFFGDDDELLDKIRFYLARPALREAIARAGLERCVRGGYSNEARMAWMMARVPVPAR
jgi:spore maturation protein CgeB